MAGDRCWACVVGRGEERLGAGGGRSKCRRSGASAIRWDRIVRCSPPSEGPARSCQRTFLQTDARRLIT